MCKLQSERAGSFKDYCPSFRTDSTSLFNTIFLRRHKRDFVNWPGKINTGKAENNQKKEGIVPEESSGN